MPSIAQLNVRVGLIFKDLDKGLEQVERRLRSSGRRLSQLGGDITVAISGPLGLIGASAITAAGNLESLQLAMVSTFESAGRGAGDAQKEIEALRKSALAPGLDLEQAIKASIRLQSVGDSAEAARKTIEGVANAVALTGGTAANLESVTVQMSQMISKGKVLSQDLRIIQENMPIISKLMKQAFGTSNAEDIQNLGITGKEFVDKITLELQKLPKVSGGIQNAIVNAGAAVKNFLATIGLEINKVFDIGAKSDQFSAFLKSAAEGFANLSDGTKRFIVEFGLVAVAAGPAIKVFGVLKSTAAQVIDLFQGGIGIIKTMAGGVITAAEAFSRLNLVMKVSVIGAVLAVVTALYFAFENLSSNVSATTEVLQKSSQAASEERAKTEFLIDVIKDQNAGYREKQGALKKLQEIAPEYFKGLDLEKTSIEQLNKAYDSYIDSIIRAARAKAAEEKLIELDRKQLEILERRNRLQASGTGDFKKSTGGFGSVTAFDQQALNAKKELIDAAEQEAKANQKEMDSLKALIRENTNLAGSNEVVSNTTQKAVLSAKDRAKAAREQAKAEKEVFDELDAITEQLLAMNEQEQRLKDLQVAPKIPEGGGLGTTQFGTALDPVKSTTAGTDRLKEVQDTLANVGIAATASLTPIDQLLQALSAHAIGFGDSWKILTEIVQGSSNTMGQALGAAASAFVQSAAAGEASFKSLGQAALQGAAAVIRAKLIESVASVAADAFKKFGLLGFIGAAVGGGAVVGLFNKLVSSIKVPGFALGTNYAPGGLALVGERGPELVNLPRGAQVTPNNKIGRLAGNNAANNVNVTGQFVLRGTDLVVALEKQNSINNRIRGF